MNYFDTAIETTLPLFINDMHVSDIDCEVEVSEDGCGGYIVDRIILDDLRDGVSDQVLSRETVRTKEEKWLWNVLYEEAMRSDHVKGEFGIEHREAQYWEAA